MKSLKDKAEVESAKKFQYPGIPKRRSDNVSYATSTVICNLKRFSLEKEISMYSINYTPALNKEKKDISKKLDIFKKMDKLKDLFGNYVKYGDYIYTTASNSKAIPNIRVSIGEGENSEIYEVFFKYEASFTWGKQICNVEEKQGKIKPVLSSVMKQIFRANKDLFIVNASSFCDKRNFVEVNCINPKDSITESKGKIRSNYSVDIAITSNGLLFKINHSNMIFPAVTVFQKMKEIGKKYGSNLSDIICKKEINDYFEGKAVVCHPADKFCVYEIDGISYDKTIINTLLNIKKKSDLVSMCIKDYYSESYNITLKEESQPIITAHKKGLKNNAFVFLVPEITYLIGFEGLDEEGKKLYINQSKINANDKIKKINNGYECFFSEEKKASQIEDSATIKSPDDIRAEWGINIADFVEVKARCIPLPKIYFNERDIIVPTSNGRFHLVKCYDSEKFRDTKFVVISITDKEEIAKLFWNNLSKTAFDNYGITLSSPEYKYFKDKTEIGVFNELMHINYEEIKIPIIILNEKTKSLYSLIKRYFCTQTEWTSQFVLTDKKAKIIYKTKENYNYYKSIIPQIVAKAKCKFFRIDCLNANGKMPSMVIGVDSSTKTKFGLKYVVVSSYNKYFNKYYTNFEFEKIDNSALKSLFHFAIEYYRKARKEYPSSIIVFIRGGIRKSKEIEKTDLRAINEFFSGFSQIKYSIFIVYEKADIKFFQKDNKSQYQNILTGTVVDEGITFPERFIFYLQSHVHNYSWSSPAKYICIFNNNTELAVEDFQDITYWLCYNYANWSGPIKIPAVLKLAHVANSFTNRIIPDDKFVSEELKSAPYYI